MIGILTSIKERLILIFYMTIKFLFNAKMHINVLKIKIKNIANLAFAEYSSIY